MAKEISKNSQYVRFDWAIKRILRDTANKKVLEGLITVLVGKPVTIIEIIESGNNRGQEQLRRREGEDGGRRDCHRGGAAQP